MGCGAYRTAVQAIANVTQTALLFDNEIWDSHGYFVPTSSTFTVPVGTAGIYVVSVEVSCTVNVGFAADLVVNGSTIATAALPTNDTAGGGTHYGTTIAQVVSLSVGSVLSVNILQVSGVSRNYTGKLTITRVSA